MDMLEGCDGGVLGEVEREVEREERKIPHAPYLAQDELGCPPFSLCGICIFTGSCYATATARACWDCVGSGAALP